MPDVFDKTNVAARNIFTFDSDKEFAAYENQNDATNKLPLSLFYDAQGDEDGRSGLFNYHIIGDSVQSTQGGSIGGKFRYSVSEFYEHNQVVTPEVSRNPTASAIIKETTSGGAYLDPKSKYVSQPYNVKDFIFCKHYGVIPNNRMITLRRFPTPVMDNLRVPIPGPRIEQGATSDGRISAVSNNSEGLTSDQMKKTGAALPITQAVTFWGEGTGNKLEDIISINTGLKWQAKNQNKKLQSEGNDPGFMASQLGEIMKGLGSEGFNKNATGISNLIGTFTDPDNIDMQVRRLYWDKLTNGDGPLSQRIFVDVNTVDKLYVRDQGFNGGETSFNLTFTYSLTSVGTINSKMLFIDLLANLLALGTDYGKFLTPQLLYNPNKQGIGFPGGSAGYVKSLTNPVEYLNEMLANNFTESLQAKKKVLETNVKKAQDELTGLKNGKALPKDGVVYKTLTALLSTKMIEKIKYEPVMLSGYPTGEWHVVVGNPLNPIAMMGNMICDGISIKLNNVLGPDDFPTEMTAIFSMKSARQKHRGDYESMFNHGKGRLYLGKMSVSEQSKNQLVTANSNTDINGLNINDTRALFPSLTNTGD